LPPENSTARATTVFVILVLCALSASAYQLPSFAWRFIAFPVFIALLYGHSFLGMLTSNAWRVLGTISYSVYLVHATILFLSLGLVDRWRPLKEISDIQLLAILAAIGGLIVVLSCLTYRFIEFPFMHKQSKYYAPRPSLSSWPKLQGPDPV